MKARSTVGVVVLVAVCAVVSSTASGSLITFTDQSSYLTQTGSAATAAVPNVGLVTPPYTVGDLTFSLGPGAISMSVGMPGGDFTVRTVGNDIALSGLEDLNVDLASAVFAFGFEFVEPENDPNVNGPFVDSTFQVTLLAGGVAVGSFTYNAPNDTFAFVGAWSDQAFDRVEIREIVGNVGNEFFGQFFTGTIPMPEPTAIGLLMIGGSALLRRRAG